MPLTGPGGIGQVRAVLELAFEHVGDLAPGVWSVPLTELPAVELELVAAAGPAGEAQAKDLLSKVHE